jgi:hypothetical protein
MSIIPSTAITIDGTTAWTLFYGTIGEDGMRDYDALNRPCNACYGYGQEATAHDGTVAGGYVDCPDCAGTGRHCFTLDVECVLPMCVNGQRGYWQDGHPCGYCNATGTSQLSVHVVEVLPIVYNWNDWMTKPLVSIERDGSAVLVENRIDGFCEKVTDITLPADAAAGKFAVRLEIHKAQA